jgi:hypothetical protein
MYASLPRRPGTPGPRHPARSLAAIAAAIVAVYACSDATSPDPTGRPPGGANVHASPAVTVTPGVTTVCKVGPGATFQVRVGLEGTPQTVTVTDGQCANVASVNPAAQDDVIVTVTENTAPYYALDHIVFQHGDGPEQTITGTNSVSFEGAHGAALTFYNNAVVTVCKVGTDATFQYQVGLGAPFNALALHDGECSEVAHIPPAAADDVIVTVRENSSPSYQLDHITFIHGGNSPQTITGTSSVSFEGVHGAQLTFHNLPVSPPATTQGCTYTPGYYKNKGSHLLPSGNFFHSGQSWLEVLETAPKHGNAYYGLAHHYIAAVMNAKSASTTPPVDNALSAAATYFGVATPADWSADGAYSKDQLTGWAGTLGAYNEGSIGPGHCD